MAQLVFNSAKKILDAKKDSEVAASPVDGSAAPSVPIVPTAPVASEAVPAGEPNKTPEA